MEVTASGKLSWLVKAEQPEKASSPMVIIELGNTRLQLRCVQSLKAYGGIEVTPVPTFTVVSEVHPVNIKVVLLPIVVQLTAL